MSNRILNGEWPGRAKRPSGSRRMRPSARQESINPEPREPQPEQRP